MRYQLKYLIASTTIANIVKKNQAILLLSKGRLYPGLLERLRLRLLEVAVLVMARCIL
jgi:hypothetical protein